MKFKQNNIMNKKASEMGLNVVGKMILLILFVVIMILITRSLLSDNYKSAKSLTDTGIISACTQKEKLFNSDWKDADKDEIPDACDPCVYFHKDLKDTDGDGFSDACEFFANTDPKDSKKYPATRVTADPEKTGFNQALRKSSELSCKDVKCWYLGKDPTKLS